MTGFQSLIADEGSRNLPDSRTELLKIIKETNEFYLNELGGDPIVEIRVSWLAALLGGHPFSWLRLERYWHATKGINVDRAYGGRDSKAKETWMKDLKDRDSFSIEQLASAPNPDSDFMLLMDIVRSPWILWNNTLGRLLGRANPPSWFATLIVKAKTGSERIVLEWLWDDFSWETIVYWSKIMDRGIRASQKLKETKTKEEKVREQAEFELLVEDEKRKIIASRQYP